MLDAQVAVVVERRLPPVASNRSVSVSETSVVDIWPSESVADTGIDNKWMRLCRRAGGKAFGFPLTGSYHPGGYAFIF